MTTPPAVPGSVIALAGRRIDAPDAQPSRFPPANAPTVRGRIRARFIELGAEALVSSAAAGADLLALDAAGELGLRRVLVLPFDRERFRGTSVTDRPGEEERWGQLFDRILGEVPPADVITLGGKRSGTAAYAAANERILDEAQRLAPSLGAGVVAVVVWDGASRGKDDLTAQFGDAARQRRIPVQEILTR